MDKDNLSDMTRNIIGSWRLENLEISTETIADMEALAHGNLTPEIGIERVRQRILQDNGHEK
ncbi:TPA: antitoxin VbhA family protein [Neisseria meningitidis]|uniref:antitoxin VbhA family protein n=1 Tax=Neisseria meningitidis TaxID=487 RepID=UPI00038B6097|nr:antitoxin VbhA family protein [Neisseria meningitidis]EQD18284.1 hypothetical protein NM3173_1496 [Neisseria meningitidis NM3173]CWN76066.1 Uncharacterised protein [Neisseria meningitidis]CWR65388.1 Uncharacterised protein [Neisseria meningitidis]